MGDRESPGPGAAAARPLALDPLDLARLSSLSVRARVIVEGAFAGMHHNLHAGTSMEFTEHKEYSPGDEIRRIDWKAVGRVDRYYVKRFEDETEMRTYLLVDASASMGYRRKGVSKLEYAGYLAGGLGYLLGQQGDPAGLLLYDEAPRAYLPPSTRGGQVRELLRLLETAEPAGRTNWARALGHLGDLAGKRSLVLVFSDLLDADGDAVAGPAGQPTVARGASVDRLRQLRAHGHDVVLFHLLDPDEVELPFDDLTFFEAMEPGDGRTLLAEAADLREAFRQESAAFRERWRQACLEARVEYRFATTADRPADVLRAFLNARQGSRR